MSTKPPIVCSADLLVLSMSIGKALHVRKAAGMASSKRFSKEKKLRTRGGKRSRLNFLQGNCFPAWFQAAAEAAGCVIEYDGFDSCIGQVKILQIMFQS